MAMSRYTSNSIICISENIPEYKNAGFWGKNENILVGVLVYTTEIYLSWIIQHQIWNQFNNNSKL